MAFCFPGATRTSIRCDTDRSRIQRSASVHPIKDETDLLVLEEVERRRLPLFAICFGMQVLNVSRGGTLIQDIGVTGSRRDQARAGRSARSSLASGEVARGKPAGFTCRSETQPS